MLILKANTLYMKFFKLSLIVFSLLLISQVVVHKFYVSVTQIEYVEKQQSVQIISRIFIDDLERDLQNHYDKNITLAVPNESNKVNTFLAAYLQQNIIVKINNQACVIKFLGKVYDGDIAKCYLEIEQVSNINTINISNSILFSLFSEQKNIVKTRIYAKDKSTIQTLKNPTTVLNF